MPYVYKTKVETSGAARETRTPMGKPHLALNQACLPVPAWPHSATINE